MKLIIQIPCYNEEQTLPQTLAGLPKAVPGIDRIEVLVIDDGSTDGTADVARRAGVDHIVRHPSNKGLASAFQTGLDVALRLGAHIIVNTDADHQYPGRYIPALVRPILNGEADVVIADRQPMEIAEFSFGKKVLQWLGSATVRAVSGTRVADAPCGFRAFSRDAAMQMHVFTRYTYTLETIIQAGKKNMTIAQVPIRTNPSSRKSRLIASTWQYVVCAVGAMMRMFVLYEPLRTFGYIGLPFLLVGVGLWARYLVLLVIEGSQRGAHIQSVVVGAVSLLVAVLIWSLGLVGEALALNRRLSEETLRLMRQWLYRVDADRTEELPEGRPAWLTEAKGRR